MESADGNVSKPDTPHVGSMPTEAAISGRTVPSELGTIRFGTSDRPVGLTPVAVHAASGTTHAEANQSPRVTLQNHPHSPFGRKLEMTTSASSHRFHVQKTVVPASSPSIKKPPPQIHAIRHESRQTRVPTGVKETQARASNSVTPLPKPSVRSKITTGMTSPAAAVETLSSAKFVDVHGKATKTKERTHPVSTKPFISPHTSTTFSRMTQKRSVDCLSAPEQGKRCHVAHSETVKVEPSSAETRHLHHHPNTDSVHGPVRGATHSGWRDVDDSIDHIYEDPSIDVVQLELLHQIPTSGKKRKAIEHERLLVAAAQIHKLKQGFVEKKDEFQRRQATINKLSEDIRTRNRAAVAKSTVTQAPRDSQLDQKKARKGEIEDQPPCRKPPVPRLSGRDGASKRERKTKTKKKKSQDTIKSASPVSKPNTLTVDDTDEMKSDDDRDQDALNRTAPVRVSESILNADSFERKLQPRREGEEGSRAADNSNVIKGDVSSHVPYRKRVRRVKRKRVVPSGGSEQREVDSATRVETIQRRAIAREYMAIQRRSRQYEEAQRREAERAREAKRRAELQKIEEIRMEELAQAKKKRIKRQQRERERERQRQRQREREQALQQIASAAAKEAELNADLRDTPEFGGEDAYSNDDVNCENQPHRSNAENSRTRFEFDDGPSCSTLPSPLHACSEVQESNPTEPTSPVTNRSVNLIAHGEKEIIHDSNFGNAELHDEKSDDGRPASCPEVVNETCEVGGISLNKPDAFPGESSRVFQSETQELTYKSLSEQELQSSSDEDKNFQFPEGEIEDQSEGTDNANTQLQFINNTVCVDPSTFIGLGEGESFDFRAIGVQRIAVSWPLEDYDGEHNDEAGRLDRPSGLDVGILSCSASSSSCSTSHRTANQPDSEFANQIGNGANSPKLLGESVGEYTRRLEAHAANLSKNQDAESEETNVSADRRISGIHSTLVIPGVNNKDKQTTTTRTFGSRSIQNYDGSRNAGTGSHTVDAGEALLRLIRESDDSLSVIDKEAKRLFRLQQEQIKRRKEQREQHQAEELIASLISQPRNDVSSTGAEVCQPGSDDNVDLVNEPGLVNEEGEAVESEVTNDVLDYDKLEKILETVGANDIDDEHQETISNTTSPHSLRPNVSFWNDLVANAGRTGTPTNISSHARVEMDVTEIREQEEEQKRRARAHEEGEPPRPHSPHSLAKRLLAAVDYHDSIHEAHLQLSMMEKSHALEQVQQETLALAQAFKNEMDSNLVSHQLMSEHTALEKKFDDDLKLVVTELEAVQDSEKEVHVREAAALKEALRKANQREIGAQTEVPSTVDATTDANLRIDNGMNTDATTAEVAVQYEFDNEQAVASIMPANGEVERKVPRQSEQVIHVSTSTEKDATEYTESYADETFDVSHQQDGDAPANRVGQSLVSVVEASVEDEDIKAPSGDGEYHEMAYDIDVSLESGVVASTAASADAIDEEEDEVASGSRALNDNALVEDVEDDVVGSTVLNENVSERHLGGVSASVNYTEDEDFEEDDTGVDGGGDTSSHDEAAIGSSEAENISLKTEEGNELSVGSEVDSNEPVGETDMGERGGDRKDVVQSDVDPNSSEFVDSVQALSRHSVAVRGAEAQANAEQIMSRVKPTAPGFSRGLAHTTRMPIPEAAMAPLSLTMPVLVGESQDIVNQYLDQLQTRKQSEEALLDIRLQALESKLQKEMQIVRDALNTLEKKMLTTEALTDISSQTRQLNELQLRQQALQMAFLSEKANLDSQKAATMSRYYQDLLAFQSLRNDAPFTDINHIQLPPPSTVVSQSGVLSQNQAIKPMISQWKEAKPVPKESMDESVGKYEEEYEEEYEEDEFADEDPDESINCPVEKDESIKSEAEISEVACVADVDDVGSVATGVSDDNEMEVEGTGEQDEVISKQEDQSEGEIPSDAEASNAKEEYDDDEFASVSESEHHVEEVEDVVVTNDNDDIQATSEADEITSAKTDQPSDDINEEDEDQVVYDYEDDDYDDEFASISELEGGNDNKDDSIGEEETDELDAVDGSGPAAEIEDSDEGANATGLMNKEDDELYHSDEYEAVDAVGDVASAMSANESAPAVSQSDDSSTTKLLIAEVDALQRRAHDQTENELRRMKEKNERKKEKALALLRIKLKLLAHQKEKFRQDEERKQVNQIAEFALATNVDAEMEKARIMVQDELARDMDVLRQTYPELVPLTHADESTLLPARDRVHTQEIHTAGTVPLEVSQATTTNPQITSHLVEESVEKAYEDDEFANDDEGVAFLEGEGSVASEIGGGNGKTPAGENTAVEDEYVEDFASEVQSENSEENTSIEDGASAFDDAPGIANNSGDPEVSNDENAYEDESFDDVASTRSSVAQDIADDDDVADSATLVGAITRVDNDRNQHDVDAGNGNRSEDDAEEQGYLDDEFERSSHSAASVGSSPIERESDVVSVVKTDAILSEAAPALCNAPSTVDAGLSTDATSRSRSDRMQRELEDTTAKLVEIPQSVGDVVGSPSKGEVCVRTPLLSNHRETVSPLPEESIALSHGDDDPWSKSIEEQTKRILSLKDKIEQRKIELQRVQRQLQIEKRKKDLRSEESRLYAEMEQFESQLRDDERVLDLSRQRSQLESLQLEARHQNVMRSADSQLRHIDLLQSYDHIERVEPATESIAVSTIPPPQTADLEVQVRLQSYLTRRTNDKDRHLEVEDDSAIDMLLAYDYVEDAEPPVLDISDELLLAGEDDKMEKVANEQTIIEVGIGEGLGNHEELNGDLLAGFDHVELAETFSLPEEDLLAYYDYVEPVQVTQVFRSMEQGHYSPTFEVGTAVRELDPGTKMDSTGQNVCEETTTGNGRHIISKDHGVQGDIVRPDDNGDCGALSTDDLRVQDPQATPLTETNLQTQHDCSDHLVSRVTDFLLADIIDGLNADIERSIHYRQEHRLVAVTSADSVLPVENDQFVELVCTADDEDMEARDPCGGMSDEDFVVNEDIHSESTHRHEEESLDDDGGTRVAVADVLRSQVNQDGADKVSCIIFDELLLRAVRSAVSIERKRSEITCINVNPTAFELPSVHLTSQNQKHASCGAVPTLGQRAPVGVNRSITRALVEKIDLLHDELRILKFDEADYSDHGAISTQAHVLYDAMAGIAMDTLQRLRSESYFQQASRDGRISCLQEQVRSDLDAILALQARGTDELSSFERQLRADGFSDLDNDDLALLRSHHRTQVAPLVAHIQDTCLLRPPPRSTTFEGPILTTPARVVTPRRRNSISVQSASTVTQLMAQEGHVLTDQVTELLFMEMLQHELLKSS